MEKQCWYLNLYKYSSSTYLPSIEYLLDIMVIRDMAYGVHTNCKAEDFNGYFSQRAHDFADNVEFSRGRRASSSSRMCMRMYTRAFIRSNSCFQYTGRNKIDQGGECVSLLDKNP